MTKYRDNNRSYDPTSELYLIAMSITTQYLCLMNQLNSPERLSDWHFWVQIPNFCSELCYLLAFQLGESHVGILGLRLLNYKITIMAPTVLLPTSLGFKKKHLTFHIHTQLSTSMPHPHLHPHRQNVHQGTTNEHEGSQHPHKSYTCLN